MPPGNRFEGRFQAEVPDAVLTDIVETLFAAYRLAWQLASQYSPATARNLYPHERLACVAEGVRRLAVGRGLPVRDQRTRCGGYTYLEMDCGIVVMTAHAVSAPREFPRDAVHRQELALGNLDLFGGPEPPRPEDKLYVMILHAPRPDEAAEPAFVDIGIPDASTKEFVGYISLLQRFPVLYARLRGVAPEEIGAEPELRRRRMRRSDTGDSA